MIYSFLWSHRDQTSLISTPSRNVAWNAGLPKIHRLHNAIAYDRRTKQFVWMIAVRVANKLCVDAVILFQCDVKMREKDGKFKKFNFECVCARLVENNVFNRRRRLSTWRPTAGNDDDGPAFLLLMANRVDWVKCGWDWWLYYAIWWMQHATQNVYEGY